MDGGKGDVSKNNLQKYICEYIMRFLLMQVLSLAGLEQGNRKDLEVCFQRVLFLGGCGGGW
jgi:hypothetical protein